MSESNKLYKYRTATLNNIVMMANNKFWAAKPETLNDPFEASIINQAVMNSVCGESLFKSLQKFQDKNPKRVNTKCDLSALANEFGQSGSSVKEYLEYGVFSLSKCNKNKLLWSHYADSFKGLVIEYDQCKFNNSTTPTENKDVVYISEKSDRENNKNSTSIEYYLCHKPDDWKYENEVRFIYNKSGEITHSPDCITAIYFGFIMEPDIKKFIMNIMSNRGIKFYDVGIAETTYQLTITETSPISS